ncbi:ABC transporter permease [Methylococcus capsulatus]|uniref:ABC transporter permease n=1 Tax=Methylococcus capsulatus TaxID=414 RepID=UPI001C530BDA|nr:ABC transporter permease [Methylococcus capsulatus]QXP87228.1 ABC transporter permease [Methylococcus capsulatus]QXP93092.1 ABC transporter permease [Methylococcus capsulatus]UQN12223.1 ABC transporter permease [Methylococcus capsulatus]
MRHDFYLAWRHLRHHRTRTLILVLCLGLIAALPLGLHQVLEAGEYWMTRRAEATPLLVGARGSSVDLTLGALYFSETGVPTIRMQEADRITATGWADALPVYARHRVQDQPLIGVTLDYFDFRGLAPAQGELPAILGDCVLGADAADRLGLGPGDTLASSSENAFDLAGSYPLKLHVTGVLAKAHSPDDHAVFVDIQTAWIIEGLGHGHGETQAAPTQPDSPFGSPAVRRADAGLLTYTEITPENLEFFHFHGDPATYPISAVIALPHDTRAATLLQGRYLDDDSETEIVRPLDVTRGLLQNIFRVGALFDGILLLVGTIALLLVALVFSLSLRLRQREIETIYLLGCARLTVLRLLFAEILLIALIAAAVCAAVLATAAPYASDLARHFILS